VRKVKEEGVNDNLNPVCGLSASANAGQNAQLERELQRAVVNGEFFLEFQPIVRLSTGSLVGAEALVRWRHPTRGVVMPNDFIPFAESTGLIVPIGEFVLEQACALLREWQDHDPRPLVLSFNVSAVQVTYGDFVRVVAECLDEYRIEPGRLRLEITETASFEDAAVAVRRLRELKQLGVSIVLDDFGAGYSSLSRLMIFEVDGLKVDGSFARAVPHDQKAVKILECVAGLARALDLSLLVEGVESERQADWLRRLGNVEIQGFLFSRPMSLGSLRAAIGSGISALSVHR
jgi:EAL domain-containing protein (putative c-di-GMP-specific phosphodiesterase class I)